jgi:hypothetical protein
MVEYLIHIARSHADMKRENMLKINFTEPKLPPVPDE